MNEQKILAKLHRKAEPFETTEVPENKIMDVEEIYDFYKWGGKLCFIEDGQYFLKNTKQGWMRFGKKHQQHKELPEMPTPQIKNEDLKKIIDKINELDNAQVKLGKWAINMKKYVDSNFSQLYKNIDVILKNLERINASKG